MKFIFLGYRTEVSYFGTYVRAFNSPVHAICIGIATKTMTNKPKKYGTHLGHFVIGMRINGDRTNNWKSTARYQDWPTH